MSWQALTAQTYALGESPFWHPHEQMLYWVDIPGRQLLRANIYMGTVQAWDMPSEPGCIAPAASGGLVVALRPRRPMPPSSFPSTAVKVPPWLSAKPATR